MIFLLIQDFADGLDAMPAGHPRKRILALLDEAIRRDVQFIDRHPTTLFQCLWNTCWWYDCPEAARHYDLSNRTSDEPLPWNGEERPLSTLLESWRGNKEIAKTGRPWLRSLRPPPVNLGTAQRLVLHGHTDWVRRVRFSPDGSRLASASSGQRVGDSSQGKSIRVWDSSTGRELLRIRGHSDGVNDLDFSPDGGRIASASNDGTARVWNADTGDEIVRFEGHASSVRSVCFSPDGHRLVSAGDNTVRVWDASTGDEKLRIDLPASLMGACISPDGRRIAGTTIERAVLVWDSSTGEELLRFHSHPEPAVRTGYLFDIRAGSELSPVNEICFSPDGRQIATVSGDETARVWCAESGAELLRIHNPEVASLQIISNMNEVESVDFSPDGRLLVTGAWDKNVRVWDAESGEALHLFEGHSSWVYGVCFSPGGRRVASASRDRTVRIWDLTGGEVLPLTGHRGRITTLRFSSDGRQLASTSVEMLRRVWDTATGLCTEIRETAEQDFFGFQPAPLRTPWELFSNEIGIGFAENETHNTIAVCPFSKAESERPCFFDQVLAWWVENYIHLMMLEGVEAPPARNRSPEEPLWPNFTWRRPASIQQFENPEFASPPPSPPTSESAIALSKIQELLKANNVANALEIANARPNEPLFNNAAGVCLLRHGRFGEASELFRRLAIDGGPHLRRDVPVPFLTNYATALYLDGKIRACLRIIAELEARSQERPVSGLLRVRIRRWKATLSWMAMLKLRLLGTGRPPSLDFLPGELVTS